jgi:ABC-2 type transport system ATP-binding protein
MTDPSLMKNKQIIAKNDVMIDVNDITKSFGEVKAVKGITFTVRRGEFFGFLAPTGRGNHHHQHAHGLARTDSGTSRLAGLDSTANPGLPDSSASTEESNLYPELTGFGQSVLRGALYGLGRAARKKRAGNWTPSGCQRPLTAVKGYSRA